MSTSNPFFQRNTIPAHTVTATPTVARVRAKRAASVATLKHNPQAWQHREVFDSGLYRKVSFFSGGLEGVRSGRERGRGERELEEAWGRLGEAVGDPGLGSFAVNYCNHWGLVGEAGRE